MNTAQEIHQKVQGQALDAIRKTQDVVVETVNAWTKTANRVPGVPRLTQQFPASAEVIDDNFDFVEKFLSNQRTFAKRLFAATAPEKSAPEKTASPQQPARKKAAPTRTAPTKNTNGAAVAVKKDITRKSATATKKSSTVQPRARRSKNQ